MQIPSWNEFDCDDFDGENMIPQENSNALNFEHQLINELDKHVSSISHYSGLNPSANSGSSASASAPASSSSSISSASSYNTQIFESVDLLNLSSFPSKSSADDENIHRRGTITSPTSSCVSPLLTSVNSTEKNNYNMSNMDYQIDSASTIPPYPSAFDASYINIKHEEEEEEDVPLPSKSFNNASPPSSSATLVSYAGSASAQASAATSSSSLSTLTEETGSTLKNSSSSAGSKKPKEVKSGGRIKKPMTMVQRKAHNKIERKYRININSKIANLQKLVPWMSEDGVAFEIDSKSGKKVPIHTDAGDEFQMPSSPASNKKLNKSMILDMVTEYLLLLKDECRKKDAEISDLKAKLFESSASFS
ncbi:hypothetical protein PMKS-000798 [Pichia membranifaciens]|uniref:BHLH domain-containing protein n=1 Tax=Pichia membranifaciens TaxID=4926 RepID=A0A1Q2YCR4_9ASCO|nr:hypothetical protein PMKS-000798 [Pichia membranifaciens]